LGEIPAAANQRADHYAIVPLLEDDPAGMERLRALIDAQAKRPIVRSRDLRTSKAVADRVQTRAAELGRLARSHRINGVSVADWSVRLLGVVTDAEPLLGLARRSLRPRERSWKGNLRRVFLDRDGDRPGNAERRLAAGGQQRGVPGVGADDRPVAAAADLRLILRPMIGMGARVGVNSHLGRGRRGRARLTPSSTEN